MPPSWPSRPSSTGTCSSKSLNTSTEPPTASAIPLDRSRAPPPTVDEGPVGGVEVHEQVAALGVAEISRWWRPAVRPRRGRGRWTSARPPSHSLSETSSRAWCGPSGRELHLLQLEDRGLLHDLVWVIRLLRNPEEAGPLRGRSDGGRMPRHRHVRGGRIWSELMESFMGQGGPYLSPARKRGSQLPSFARKVAGDRRSDERPRSPGGAASADDGHRHEEQAQQRYPEHHDTESRTTGTGAGGTG